MRASTTAMLIVLTAACTGSPPPRPTPVFVVPPPSASATAMEDIVFEPGPDASIEDAAALDTAAPQEEAGQCETPVRPQRVLDRIANDPRFRWCSKDSDCGLYGPEPGCECVPYFSLSTQAMNWKAWQKGHGKCLCESPSSLTYEPVCRAGICRVLDRGYEERCLEDGTYWMPRR